MDAANRRCRRVREVAAPAWLAVRVSAIGDVRRQHVEPRSWSLAQEMDNHIGADEAADLVADAHPSVLNDDDHISDIDACASELWAEQWQQSSDVLVDRIGIQSVRHDEQQLRR